MQGVNTPSTPFGDLRGLAPSFRRSLKAGNKSERTIKIYVTAADRLVGFLEESGGPRKGLAMSGWGRS